jgi:hypothetical protein
MRRKKAQITVFVIIGIVAVLAVALTIFLTQKPQQLEARIPSIQDVPSAVVPVQEFVQACVHQVAEQGVTLIGEFGGYTSTNNIPDLDVDPLQPTESNAVQFSAGSSLTVPYWWYLESDNECVGRCSFATKRPGLRRGDGINIEEQLDDFVSNNLPGCIQNFVAFPQFTITAKDVKTTTQVSDARVSVLVDYPLTITQNNAEFKIDEFFAVVDVRLGEIYEFATEINSLQADNKFLEKHTKQLLSSFSKADESSLPPFYHIDIDFSLGKFWILSDVQSRVEGILAGHVPLLQVLSARNYQKLSAPSSVRDARLYDTVYNRGMVVPAQVPHPDLEVRFTYLDWWKPYFDLNCDGQLCRAESINQQLPVVGLLVGMQKYAFAYDISYPVLVTITQPDALNGKGFTFNYFMEANVRNNEAMPSNFNPLNIPSPPRTGSLLFAPNQRTSAPVKVTVMDGRLNKEVAADITFACGDEKGVIAHISGSDTIQFPRCLGGIVGAVAGSESFPAYQPLDTHDNKPKEIVLTVEPWRKVSVDARRVRMVKSDVWSVQDHDTLPHGGEDQTIIILEREGNVYEEKFQSYAEVFGSKRESTYGVDVPLVPGNYSVQINTLHFGEVVFPPQERCEDDECFTIPKTPIIFNEEKPFPSGNARFTWELTKEALDAGNKVVFKTLVVAIESVPEKKRVIEDLEQISAGERLVPAYLDVLLPEVVLE